MKTSSHSPMDYLTVPTLPSVPQMEKPIVKEEPMLTQSSSAGTPMASVASQVPGSILSQATQEPSTIIGATSFMNKAKELKRYSKNKMKQGNKTLYPTQRAKGTAKSTRHRHKRKYRHITLKELMARSWQKIHPHLIKLRKIIYDLTQSFYFDFFVCSVVAINTILLVAQTFAVVEIRGEWFFSAMDPAFLSVYVVEAILKITALGCDYFRDPWNDIDFFIMIMTVLDFVLPLFISSRQGNRGNTVTLFRVLKICKAIRAIRAIRFLLTLRVMENLQEVTSTFMLSCQSIGAIILLMFSFLFMSSVVLRDMFHDADEKHFGDLFNTIFTLFQLFTLDDWSLIYLTCYDAGAWYIIIFLIIYILVEYFLLLNLVIAVLVDNFQMALLKRQELKRQKWIELKDSGVEEDATGKLTEKPNVKDEQDEEFFRRMVMEKYGSLELIDREWQLFYSYFRLMTAIETNQQQFLSQTSTTDKILDTFFETAEDDYPIK
ncbi:cation channel sperm-associated protein 1 [Rhineura floridana]|uniref:cation channel sperm-associated protein 1 n=1 Tax=Rhineura floridana TaxID=261503 RepID=UPI002AC85E93|nr:cation channel sperm-associated protein 1 [Rhineura floridana]